MNRPSLSESSDPGVAWPGEERDERARLTAAFAVSVGTGTTSRHLEQRAILPASLCKEIARRYGDDRVVSTDIQELVKDFPQRLALATAEQPLILVLDALDQLSDVDNARMLYWLPRELPGGEGTEGGVLLGALHSAAGFAFGECADCMF